ncbi:Prefoldin subunit 6 [Orobanche gracilis]
MAALKELQRDLENKANDLNKLQKEISKNHQVRKKYTIQLGENELVLKELDLLNEDANVYKLIGPVLVKQDLAEANANVRKRIEYISAELKRSDAALQDLDEKQNSKKEAEVFSRYNKEFRRCKLEKARRDPETASKHSVT